MEEWEIQNIIDELDIIKEKVKGRADMSFVSNIVRERLAK